MGELKSVAVRFRWADALPAIEVDESLRLRRDPETLMVEARNCDGFADPGYEFVGYGLTEGEAVFDWLRQWLEAARSERVW